MENQISKVEKVAGQARRWVEEYRIKAKGVKTTQALGLQKLANFITRIISQTKKNTMGNPPPFRLNFQLLFSLVRESFSGVGIWSSPGIIFLKTELRIAENDWPDRPHSIGDFKERSRHCGLPRLYGPTISQRLRIRKNDPGRPGRQFIGAIHPEKHR
jgi:hypothetical protein